MEMNEALNTISASGWLIKGGIAFDGCVYLPPKSAIPWGKPGCPLVPKQFRQHFGDMRIPRTTSAELGSPHVYLSELDSEAHLRFNIGDNYQRILSAVLGLGYNITDINTEVAIPSGIPLDWLLNLPVKSRALNGLRRMYSSRGWTQFAKEPILCSEILSMYGLGLASLLELLCVIESVEVIRDKSQDSGSAEVDPHDSKQISMTRSQFEFLERSIASDASEELVARFSGPILQLRNFVEWAVAETDATTIVDAFKLAMSEAILPEDVGDLFNTHLSGISDPPEHPYSLIESWLLTLSERERVIFIFRLFPSPGKRRTLEQIGEQFNVSRERIRQIEKKLPGKFETFLNSPIARAVRWRCENIRSKVGVASPRENVENLLAAPDGIVDLRAVLLSVAGYDYDLEGEWLISKHSKI